MSVFAGQDSILMLSGSVARRSGSVARPSGAGWEGEPNRNPSTRTHATADPPLAQMSYRIRMVSRPGQLRPLTGGGSGTVLFRTRRRGVAVRGHSPRERTIRSASSASDPMISPDRKISTVSPATRTGCVAMS